MKGGKGVPARRPPRDRWLFPIHPDDLPDEEAGGLTGGVVGHVGRRMRPTWGIDGWDVAKHDRILPVTESHVHLRVNRRELKG